MLNPLRPFLELSRRVSRRYAAPFLVLALLAFSTACLGLALAAKDPLLSALVVLASVSGLVAIASVAYVLFVKPELLLSDETLQLRMLLSWLHEPETDDRRMMSAERILPSLLADQVAKQPGEQHDAEDEA